MGLGVNVTDLLAVGVGGGVAVLVNVQLEDKVKVGIVEGVNDNLDGD